MGGKLLTISLVHRLLTNPFYAGILVWQGQNHAGAHVAIVSPGEFEQVQRILHRPLKASPKKHAFPFTGVIRCGECGCSVTAYVIINRFGSRYSYYHCSRQKRERPCGQKPIRAEALEKQLGDFIKTVALPPAVFTWLKAELDERSKDRERERLITKTSVENAITALAKERANLTTIRLRELIDDAEFVIQQKRLEDEQRKLAEAKKSADEGTTWLDAASVILAGWERVALWFQRGDPAVKRQIFGAVTSNPVLKDKIHICEAALPFMNRGRIYRRPRSISSRYSNPNSTEQTSSFEAIFLRSREGILRLSR
jgi:hypothetical protein